MKELLSPAGNMECLLAAINAGADACYISGKSFGARAFAPNFTNEELKEAVKYAHLYGVKIYVTTNIIIYNNEVEEFIKYIEYLYQIGVDALIMQDIGMISLVRKTFPDLEIHASTQLHNHNKEGIQMLQDLGVTRVVLDREMTLKQIEELNIDIEKEVFIHGALCNSYSGCCLFSSLNGGRSGNRGECTQPCRLPYNLITKDKTLIKNKYLLSTKELNSIHTFNKLMQSDIKSFKIEGRMKSPAYVSYVTRIYRSLIDNYPINKITKEQEDNLKILFNRQFTSGFLFEDNITNIDTPNHQGLRIGKVLDITPKKIKILLEFPLYQEDGLRFKNTNKGLVANYIYDSKGKLINKANKNDIIYLDNKINLKEKDILIKTSSPHLNKEILSYPTRKIPINITITPKENNLNILLEDNLNNKVQKEIPIYKPKTINTTKEEIQEKITKLGNTPYKINKIKIELPKDIFISMKDLNTTRRELLDKLTEIRTKVSRKIPNYNINLNYQETPTNNYEITVSVRTKPQLLAALSQNVDRIYISKELYQEYQDNPKIYLRTPRVVIKYEDISNNLLIGELGALNHYKGKNIITDYYFNVINNYTIKYLLDQGAYRVTLSPEIDYSHLEEYIKDKVELIIYGKIELMISKSSIIKPLPNTKYYLEDIHHNHYPLIEDNYTHIYHYKNIDYLDKLNYYKELGIKSYRLELLEEDYNQTIKLINKLKDILK